MVLFCQNRMDSEAKDIYYFVDIVCSLLLKRFAVCGDWILIGGKVGLNQFPLMVFA